MKYSYYDLEIFISKNVKTQVFKFDKYIDIFILRKNFQYLSLY